MHKVRVFINGFGRIGRSALRIMLEDDALEVVGINDIFPVSQFKYLLQYDSLYKSLPEQITLEHDRLTVGQHQIKLFCQKDPSDLDLAALNIDLLLQCSGHFLTLQSNEAYLQQGVKKVILSTPAQDSMPTYIMGFNHQNYQNEKIISNSSCSNNAIAPIIHTIENHYGIRHACISMIHSYTSDQNLLDGKSVINELRRSRSATQNILPLHSTATSTLASLFPHLKNKLYTKSIRVPVNATTLYDFTLFIQNPTNQEELNALFIEKSQCSLHNIIDTDNTHKVSSDYIQNRHGATIDLSLTEVLDDHCVKISAWQDNEYGYAYQLVQMAKFIST
ncbi:MAG: glyceraldehyde 3-phosphate dehydrogenase NAD-binding domain-containing protein [Campylobacterota bacterium]|nr:glyceraldehyde 3-phosphate dehydrogenase NAD-binding domain-containing protein [Campylobacterota bacterium]